MTQLKDRFGAGAQALAINIPPKERVLRGALVSGEATAAIEVPAGTRFIANASETGANIYFTHAAGVAPPDPAVTPNSSAALGAVEGSPLKLVTDLEASRDDWQVKFICHADVRDFCVEFFTE